MDADGSQVSTLTPHPSLIWYPLDQISVVKCWDLMVVREEARTTNGREWEHVPELHRLLIRADTGEVIEDINLTWTLETATFTVFDDDSPEPSTPGADTPTNGLAVEVSRTNITLIAIDTNASPQGWIPVGNNTLAGNNADVYADWDDNDSPDGPTLTGTPYRVFNYPIDLQYPPASDYVDASKVQAFYVINQFHDRLWQLGFDEPAGNFQISNFGRGGSGGDAMIVEVQNDYTARAGGLYGISAWYTGYGDGSVGKISVNTSTVPPGHDGAHDAQVLIHEATHGLSTRLIGNGFGLTTTQSRGLAEGWSDFFPLALLSESSDAAGGTYPFGSYIGERYDVQHLYFGIRRFPYCTDTNKAPQTLADIDPNQIDFSPQIPRNPSYGSEDADQIHNIGEIWCLMLWECRDNLIARYGFAGNELMMQLVVDGMKLSPVNPTFIEARDAILQADLVGNAGTNQIALWCGFAKRGLGYGASVSGSVSTVGVVEDYGLPFEIVPRLNEVGGDGDGHVEPGENAELTVILASHEMALSNITAVLMSCSSNVTVTASNAVLPSIAIGGTSTSSPPFACSICGGFPGNSDACFLLSVECDQGTFEHPFSLRIGNPSDYAPEITGIAVTNLTETNAWIRWKTGVPADGQVEYGVSTNYGLSTVLDPVLRTNHLHELTGLDKGTVYHYRVISTGTNALTAYSPDQTLRTRERVYVYADSTATQELGTVDAPYRNLQAAAVAAKSYGDDILVAMGTYTSDQVEAVLVLDGSAWDLSVEGGYSPDFTERNVGWYETVIDGQRMRRGIRLDNGAKLSVDGLTITRGQSEWGGGVSVRQSEFEAVMCVVTNNSSTNVVNELGGGVYGTLGASLQFERCFIGANTAAQGGGCFMVSDSTLLRCAETVFAENTAYYTGGAVHLILGAALEMYGGEVYGNRSEMQGGGVVVAPFCSASVDRSTVASNAVWNATVPEWMGGGGIRIAGGPNRAELQLVHCVVSQNSSLLGSDLSIDEDGTVHASYCNIGDIHGTLTTSNQVISADPLFANPGGGNFHLLYGSPCIDAGMTNFGGGSVDLDGEARPFGTAMDIGADEFVDGDGDNMADYWEVATYGDTNTTSGTEDTDGDSLTTFGEYMNQTDPRDSDTDDDLAQDGWEVANSYDPLDRDMDDDLMWDGWEFNVGLNAFSNDAALNPDGDAHINLNEFAADTDPHDSNSLLTVLALGEEWGGTRIDWKGGVDSWQWLEYNTNLLDPNGWDWIAGFPPSTPITNAVIVFGLTNSPTFYRIRAQRE